MVTSLTLFGLYIIVELFFQTACLPMSTFNIKSLFYHYIAKLSYFKKKKKLVKEDKTIYVICMLHTLPILTEIH